MRVVLKSHGFEHIERSYTASAGRARQLRPALEAIGLSMMDKTKTQFESGGRRGGGSWAFPSADWAKRKMRRGLDPRPLYGTYRLIDSLTSEGDPEMVMDISSNKIVYGSAVPYAERHQHGGGGIPARPFIRFLPSDIEEFGGIILIHITDPLRRRV